MATTSPNKPLQRHQKINIIVENSTAPIESKREWKSYAEGITNALTINNHPDGSTAGIMKKYMQANLSANRKWNGYTFKSSLQKMIAKGDITKSVVLSKNKKMERYNLRQPKAVSQEDAAAAEVERNNTKKQKEAQAEAAEDAKKEAEAKAKTDAEKAEDEQVLAEFEVFLQNSTLWLRDKNEVEQMKEDEGHFVDDYVIDVALEELEENFLLEMRKVAAATPVGEPSRAGLKTTKEATKVKPKQQPMYNFRGCAPTEGAIVQN